MRCLAQKLPEIEDQPSKTRAGVSEQAPEAQHPDLSRKTGVELSLVSLQPPLGSKLSESSVLYATFDYRIVDMKKAAVYAIAPFFADRAGNDVSFNALKNVTSFLPLRHASGRVSMEYPIREEWNKTNRLARPPAVWFNLMEQNSSSKISLIAQVGPFRYE
jgi:hypothetical protein